MNKSNGEIFRKMVEEDWNLARIVKENLHFRTKYFGRPEFFSSDDWRTGKLSWRNDDWKTMVHVVSEETGCEYDLKVSHYRSLVKGVFQQLLDKLVPDIGDPVYGYLQESFDLFHQNQESYGVWVLYYNHYGEPLELIQFPEVPVWKLGLIVSNGGLIQDEKHEKNWYQIREIFNQQHLLVAGASVASAGALHAWRLIRPKAITLADPKPANVTTFNRTNYTYRDLICYASGREDSKAIALARQIHEQDPFQTVYVFPEGITEENFHDFLLGSKDGKVMSPVGNFLLEAIDHPGLKRMILTKAAQAGIPSIQLGDMGSKAMNTYLNPKELTAGQSPFLGVSNDELDFIFSNPKNFALLAALVSGPAKLMNAYESSEFMQGRPHSPFWAVPQLGSTAAITGAMAAETAARYLLNVNEDSSSVCFRYDRAVFDNCLKQAYCEVGPTEEDQQMKAGLLAQMGYGLPREK